MPSAIRRCLSWFPLQRRPPPVQRRATHVLRCGRRALSEARSERSARPTLRAANHGDRTLAQEKPEDRQDEAGGEQADREHARDEAPASAPAIVVERGVVAE